MPAYKVIQSLANLLKGAEAVQMVLAEMGTGIFTACPVNKAQAKVLTDGMCEAVEDAFAGCLAQLVSGRMMLYVLRRSSLLKANNLMDCQAWMATAAHFWLA